MKKSSQSRQKSNTTANRYSDSNTRLNDFGLEPPKIYRESQKRIEQERTKRATSREKSNNLTTAEKRKKQTKKRKKKNKLRRIVISVMAGILMIAVIVTVSLTSFFNITEFTVSGSEKYNSEEVIDNLTIKTGESLFLSDFTKAEEFLQTNLPYVYSVEFSRKLPSTLEIIITDADVAYSIKNSDGSFILLDNNFKVLEAKAEKGSGIRISKAKVSKAKEGNNIVFTNKNIEACLSSLAQEASKEEFSKITSIYSLGLNDNYVVYENRITFKLGNCDKLEKKLYQGFAACEQLNASSPNAKGTMTITGDKQIYFTEK